MAKIRVSIVDSSTLRLNEKGEINDTIDLRELQGVDTAPILDAIKRAKDSVYSALLKEKLDRQKIEQQLAVSELEKKFQHDYESLKSEKEQLSSSLNASFSVEKEKLESKIAELDRSIDDQKKIAVLQMEKGKNNEISKLKEDIEKLKSSEIATISARDNEIRILNEQLKTKDDIKKLEIKNAVADIMQKDAEQIKQKDSEITQLRLSKSNLTVKALGEELENWCNSEYQSYALSGFHKCNWFKDNVSVKDAPDEKGTKADYIFEVYADEKKNDANKLLSVCCEMKNQSPETKVKTRNADHYDKLDKDRVKKNCQYSLLISELEWDTVNDAPIKKIPGYENMYLVRPAYFISFLSLIESLANKYRALLTEHRVAGANFLASQKIIEEFDTFKNTYLDKPLNSLQSDVESIKNEANKAYAASYKIVGLADTIISNKIAEIKVKIDRFKINKIAHDVERLSPQNDLVEATEKSEY